MASLFQRHPTHVAVYSLLCAYILGIISHQHLSFRMSTLQKIGEETNWTPNNDKLTSHEYSTLKSKLLSKDKSEKIDDGAEDTPTKKYAWLMSFPNSGTSYTLKLVRHVSNSTTATNYRKDPLIAEEAKEYIDKMSGSTEETNLLHPFVSNDNSLNLPKSGYLLTKTHCGSRCSSCAPHTYLETQEEFLNNCLALQFKIISDEDDDSEHQKYSPLYSSSIIERAVHLFRDPFENAVSRFHLHRLHESERWRDKHPKNAKGFQLYCHELDKLYFEEEREIDRSENASDGNYVVDTAMVPCHGEFHRYIAWHESVLNITMSHLSIPTHIFHYEDYRDNFDDAVSKLLNFLELPRVIDTSPPFHISNYSDHFTEDQRDAAIRMMRHQASDDLWDILTSRYHFD